MIALNGEARSRLLEALRGNASDGAALRMNRDTSFGGTMTSDEVDNEDVRTIDAIRSTPCHY